MLDHRRTAALAALAAAAVITAGCTSQTVQTTGDAPGSTAPAKAAGVKAAGIGSAITVSGTRHGSQLKVTVVRVIKDAEGADSFSTAPAGQRLYAVQFRLVNTGSAAYSDTPSNGAEVTDSAGQSYNAGLGDDVKGCQAFADTVNLAPGGTALGCVAFQVPASAKVTGVQYTLDSGMGNDTGQWKVG